MSEISLNLETRTKTGSQYAKRKRRENQIPGIYYFRGKETIPFVVSKKEFAAVRGHESTLINVIFDGKEEKKCIIREIQFDPIKSSPIHIDLMGITLSEKINVSIPIHLIGIPMGVKNEGGVLQHILREVEVECLPTEIPEHIECDVSELNIGDSIHLSIVSLEKARILGDLEGVIATVGAPRVLVTEEPEEEEEEGEGEAEEPEIISQKEEEENE